MLAVSVDSERFRGVESVKADAQLCVLRRDHLDRVTVADLSDGAGDGTDGGVANGGD